MEAYSAGIVAHGLNPHAVRVMPEVGVDISGQGSKTLEEVGPLDVDCVVTVCRQGAGFLSRLAAERGRRQEQASQDQAQRQEALQSA